MKKNFKHRSRWALGLGLAAYVLAMVICTPLSGSIAKPEKVYRLTIHYQNGKMTLLEKRELNKILPLNIKERILKTGQQLVGFVFDILDAQGQVSLTSSMDDPTISHMEYPDPENPRKIIGSFIKHNDVIFSIQVPAPPAAKTIRFRRFQAPAAGVKAAQVVPEELGSFNLSD